MNEPSRDPSGAEITRMLHRLADGDAKAGEVVLEIVHQELHQMARSFMRKERSNHTLQPTALVNECYLKLLGDAVLEVSDRRHFFAIASRAMRQILIDHARRLRSQRRGGDWKQAEISHVAVSSEKRPIDLLALDEALEALGELDPRKVRVVEHRYFAGLNIQETADLLGVTTRTVERDWEFAQAWLAKRISSED